MGSALRRLNSAPVKGFEKDVGSKTTLRITYPEGAMQRPEQYERDSLFVLAGFKWQDFKWLKYIVYKERVVSSLCTRPVPSCLALLGFQGSPFPRSGQRTSGSLSEEALRGSSLGAPWVEDPVLLQLWRRLQLQLRFSSWPRNFHLLQARPKELKHTKGSIENSQKAGDGKVTGPDAGS